MFTILVVRAYGCAPLRGLGPPRWSTSFAFPSSSPSPPATHPCVIIAYTHGYLHDDRVPAARAERLSGHLCALFADQIREGLRDRRGVGRPARTTVGAGHAVRPAARVPPVADHTTHAAPGQGGDGPFGRAVGMEFVALVRLAARQQGDRGVLRGETAPRLRGHGQTPVSESFSVDFRAVGNLRDFARISPPGPRVVCVYGARPFVQTSVGLGFGKR